MTALAIEHLDFAQRMAAELLNWATLDGEGVDELHPRYVTVTEGRDGPGAVQRAKYSSCADLAHWLLRCIGVRCDWLNRADDNDGRNWKSGVNLNWLCPPPIGPCSVASSRLIDDPEPGDIFVENNVHGGHVFVAIRYDAINDILTSAEYGQPGGKVKHRKGFRAAFKRNALSHLRLRDVLASGVCVADPDVSLLDLPEAGFVRDSPFSVPGIQDPKADP